MPRSVPGTTVICHPFQAYTFFVCISSLNFEVGTFRVTGEIKSKAKLSPVELEHGAAPCSIGAGTELGKRRST